MDLEIREAIRNLERALENGMKRHEDVSSQEAVEIHETMDGASGGDRRNIRKDRKLAKA